MKLLFLSCIILMLIGCEIIVPSLPNVTQKDSISMQPVDSIINNFDTTIVEIDTIETTPISPAYGPDCVKCPWPELNSPTKNPDGTYDMLIIARGCNCCKVSYTTLLDVNSTTVIKEIDNFKQKIKRLNLIECDIDNLQYRVFYGTSLDLER